MGVQNSETNLKLYIDMHENNFSNNNEKMKW